MSLIETSTISEVTHLPLEGNIQVAWRNVITKDGETISSKLHYKLYGVEQKTQFESDLGADAAQYIALAGW